MIEPIDASKASFRNRDAVERAEEASCYFCQRTFASDAVERWMDMGETATCPHCEVDAVLPGRLPPRDLQALYEYWFTGRTGNSPP